MTTVATEVTAHAGTVIATHAGAIIAAHARTKVAPHAEPTTHTGAEAILQVLQQQIGLFLRQRAIGDSLL